MAVVDTGLRKFTDGAQHVALAGIDSVSNTADLLDSSNGKLHVMDYKDAIGAGKITNHTKFRGFGRRDNLATTAGGDDLWEGAAAARPYPNQSVGEQIVFVSTSASDAAAGTGVWKIEMHYINAAGTALVETITLTGVTPVNSVAIDVRFIQILHSIAGGSASTFGTIAPVGTITAYKVATPATIYSQLLPNQNVTLNSYRMVPTGFNFYMNYICATATANKNISVRIRATCDDDGVLTPGIFLFNEIFELQDSAVSMIMPVPRIFPPLSIIKGTAVSTVSGGSASISYGGWIEPI